MTDWLDSINPATEEVLARFPASTPDESRPRSTGPTH